MRAVERERGSLVGRDEELGRLISAITSDRPTVVVGEAGMGKSTLVRAAIAAAGLPIHEGGGFATLASMPYLALRRATGIELAGDPARVAAIVERHVGPDALFIDDLQWVDPASMDALACLAGRVLMVAALRLDDPAAGKASARADQLGLEPFPLGALTEADARHLIAQVRPDLGDDLLGSMLAQGGGNPLLLEELAAAGGTTVAIERQIGAALDRLVPDVRRSIDLLAVIDRPLALERLGRGAAADAEAAVATRLVVEAGGQLQIRHSLLASIVRDHLDEAELRDIHERAAACVDDPVEAARHLVAAGLDARATTIAIDALGRTDDPLSRAALLLVIAEASPAADRAEACLRSARAFGDLSDWAGVVRVLSSDDAAWQDLARAERAALLAHASFHLGQQADARSHLATAQAIEIDPDDPVAARVSVESIAFMVNVDGDIFGALARLDELCATLDPAGPSYAMHRVLRESVAMLANLPVDLDLITSAVDAAIDSGAYAWAADLARVVAFTRLIWTGADAALAWLDRCGDRFEAAGVSGVAQVFLAERVQAATLDGALADAVMYADESLEQPAPLRARQSAAIFRARSLIHLGRLDDAEAALDDLDRWVTDDFVGRGELLAAQADAALWGGFPRRAIALADAVHEIPSPIVGAYGLTDIVRAWARHDLGLEPEPVSTNAPTRIQAGAGPELDGLRLLHESRPEAASDAFAAGADLWAGFIEPRAMVCRWAAGDALRSAGRLDMAAERLTTALDVSVAHGFELVSARIRRSLRQAGVRGVSEHTPPAVGMRLTRRESELLALAGRGLTNIEIARRMGLGRPTVARILSNAMIKLSAGSRAQAVALATEPDSGAGA
jgi:DNA-binding CsgD family transcriptional regulator